MSTAFDKVFAYKASALKTFYKAWGIEEKSRDHHLHHCVDAIIAACVTKRDYETIANYYHECEERPHMKSKRPQPWVGFDKYVNDTIKDEVIVSHFKKNNLLKDAKKAVRKRGFIQRTESGEVKFAQGDSARGALHKDTFYGKIIDPDNGETRCVVRKSISTMTKGEKDKIVDPVIRELVLNHKDDNAPLWLNEEKGIEIKKARVFTPSVRNPIELKAHQRLSKHGHKQSYFVENGGNYALALYGGSRDEVSSKPDDEKMRSLLSDEREILAQYLETKKSATKFDALMKKILPKKAKFSFQRDPKETPYKVNYQLNTPVPGCPTIASLCKVFDCKAYSALIASIGLAYVNDKHKTGIQCLSYVWHVLTTFEDSKKRQEFAVSKLQLTDEESILFDKIRFQDGCGSLSLKAIKKFIPYIKDGIIYSQAAFFANLPEVLKDYNVTDMDIVQETIIGKL